jgi:hypothetical protein
MAGGTDASTMYDNDLDLPAPCRTKRLSAVTAR